jgi:two-component system, cell cycle sensor histidine kinase and response regulator CckA
MTDRDDICNKAGELRRQAEEVASETPALSLEDLQAMSAEEFQRVLHKMRVLQIELELQNEEFRTAQAEIEAERARYVELYDLAPLGYCTLSEKGLILEANLTAATLLGAARSDLIKQPISRFLLNEDQNVYSLYRDKLFETGERQECELRLVKPDGTHFWAHLTATAAQTADGTPVCRVVLSDITDRKQLESHIKRDKDNLWSIADAMQETLSVIALNGTFLYANQKATGNMLGEKSGDIIGKNLRELIPGVQAESLIERYQSVYRSGEPFHQEIKVGLKKGDTWFFNTLKPIEYGSPPVPAVLSVSLDITQRKQVEDELRMAKELSARIIEDGPVAMTLVDRDGKIVFANRHAEGLFGLEKPNIEALGYNSSEWLIVDVDGSPFPDERLPFRQVMSTGQAVYNVQHAITRPDAAQKILSINGAPLHDEQGRIDRVVFAILDITERKQAEEALRESEEKFRALFEKGPIGVAFHQMVYDDRGKALDYLFLDANSSYLELTGVDPRGKWVTEAFPGIENDPFDWIGTFGCVAKTGEQIRFEQYLQTNKRWYDCVGYQFKPDYFVVAFVDITERKLAEEALRKSEERFLLAMKASHDGLFDWNLETNEIYYSPAWKNMLGYEDHELPNDFSIWENTTDPEDVKQAWELQRKLISKQIDRFVFEFKMKHKDGHWVDILSRAEAFFNDSGKAVRMVGTHVDITARKQAEAEKERLEAQLQQAQKMESVGRLAGGVAHDFNNMLGVIFGHTEMALEDLNPAAPLYANLKAIQYAAQRSAALTRQLLAFARKQTVAPRVIDINETVAGMLNMLRRLIGEDIDLLWQPGENLPPLKVDPSQIDQLLANLCVNARDAIAGQGKITIETGAKTFDQAYCADHLGFLPGEYLLLEVSDDGCGMDKKILSQIFEPFFTTKEQGKGTGLGLASVYGMVKQNNGFINVYSEPGQGTTFKIYLPAFAAKSAGMVEKAPDLPAERGHEIILLVEDEPAILHMTTMMLTRLGYTVVAAATPGEAIRLALEYRGRIDLLMTDVVMPEMNGRELAGNLLSHFPDLKRLFMSGYTANVIAHHGVLDQGVHFIEKPFSMKELSGKVREVLDEN